MNSLPPLVDGTLARDREEAGGGVVTSVENHAETGSSSRSEGGRETTRARGRAIGLWAIVDQFVFSGTNFLTSVALGRLAGPTELGKYALSFSILMIVIGIQRSLLMSPYVIVRGGLSETGQRTMRGSLLFLTFVIAGVFSLLCVSGVLLQPLFAEPLLDPWMVFATALAFPAGMLRDFGRRLAIFHLQIGRAMWLDVAIMLGQFSALGAIYSIGKMDAPTVLVACSCVWAIVGAAGLFVSRSQSTFELQAVRRNFAALWPIGRWVSLTQVVVTTQAFVMPWVMALAASVKLAGIYAACWTIVQIVSPMIEGLGNLIGPKMAGSAEQRSWSGIYALMVRTSVVFAGIMLGLMLMLFVAGRFALDQLYGDEYTSYFTVLVVLALAATANNLGIPVLKALIQLGHAKVNFIISTIGLCLSLCSAAWLLESIGPSGAAWGLVVGNSVATLCRWILIHRVDRDVASAAHSPYATREVQ